MVGFGQCLRYVLLRDGPSFVCVCDQKCTARNLLDEYWRYPALLSVMSKCGVNRARDVYKLSQALQNKTGANRDVNKPRIIASMYRGRLTVRSDHLPQNVSPKFA